MAPATGRPESCAVTSTRRAAVGRLAVESVGLGVRGATGAEERRSGGAGVDGTGGTSTFASAAGPSSRGDTRFPFDHHVSPPATAAIAHRARIPGLRRTLPSNSGRTGPSRPEGSCATTATYRQVQDMMRVNLPGTYGSGMIVQLGWHVCEVQPPVVQCAPIW
jgi:hypothetical protein